MSEPLYHPAESENHSDNRQASLPPDVHLPHDPSASLDCSFTTITLENPTARLYARCHEGAALAVTIEALDRRGRPEGIFGVTDMDGEVASRVFQTVEKGDLGEALIQLSRAHARSQCNVAYEICPPRRTLHGEDGDILMLASTAPSGLSEMASGSRRTHTTLKHGDDSLLDIDLVTGGGLPARCEILLVDGDERSHYALDDESAEKLGRLAFDLIDSYIAGGHFSARSKLEEAFRPPAAEMEDDTHDRDYGWQPAEEDIPVAEAFEGKAREHELSCGSRVGYWLDGSSLQFEICSGERWSDRVVYDIRIDPLQANVERKVDYVFERLVSSSAEQQLRAVKALSTFGNWEATFHSGARQHEPLDDLRDHLMELGVEGATWSNFPQPVGPEIELALLKGLQHGIVTAPGRRLHEMSTIDFLLDSRGEGSITLSNEIGAKLEFRLPPLDADEGLFGRKRLLEGYLDRFLDSPVDLIDELCEDTGSPRATNISFPYDSDTHRAYVEVGKALEKYNATNSSSTFVPRVPAVKDLGGGRFEIAIPRRHAHGFELRMTIGRDGPDSVTLERRRPLGPMRIFGATETHSFSLHDSEADTAQIFRKHGPLSNVLGEERAHASLIEYLRRTTGYDETLRGRLSLLWRKLFG